MLTTMLTSVTSSSSTQLKAHEIQSRLASRSFIDLTQFPLVTLDTDQCRDDEGDEEDDDDDDDDDDDTSDASAVIESDFGEGPVAYRHRDEAQGLGREVMSKAGGVYK
ncbi:hypothetical protein DID88_001025 [Monilinia fructigena]|uniref:Uncharacterized protein n=1 Tax=Monilinia fructigena TaxID=38457 RepID=A0A395J4A2_9HELO|nr:hypothetical protein DID88_001025 [Monilinia fructigena]